MGGHLSQHRPTVQLLAYLMVIVISSLLIAAVVAPLVPYDYFKVLRRVATIAAGLLLFPFVLRVQRRSLRDLGLARTYQFQRQLLQGVWLGIIILGGLMVAYGWFGVVTFHWPTPRGWLTIAAFVPAALIIGLLEELFFRGVVLQSLVPDVGVGVAVVLSSVLYALVHFVKYLAEPLSILPELFGLVLFGVVLCLAYLRTRLLALSIGLHVTLAYLAKVDRQFLDFVGREPEWLFGTDGWLTGVIGWLMLGVGGWLVYLWTRRTAS